MSIFQDNITSELLIKNVYNIEFDTSEFHWAFAADDNICKEFFFKWVYDDCQENRCERIIEKIGNLPISLIENYLHNYKGIRSIRRCFKKYIKHKYSNSNSLYIEGLNPISICVAQEVRVFRRSQPDILTLRIVLTKKQ